MIKYTKFFITLLLAVIVFEAKSQSTATSSSPYSQFGLGDLSPTLLPQNIAMGGIATAITNINGYNSVNPLNPASYASIGFTTFDAGIYVNGISLSQAGHSTQKGSNFRFNHIAFAIPVTTHSAFSFGLLPYSQMGYNYKQTVKGFGTGSAIDTNTVNYRYHGEGGLTKAYIGYGQSIGRHLSLGFNATYIFGNLKHYQTTELPLLTTALNSTNEVETTVSGLNYDYGAQYTIDLSLSRHIVIGYSASAKSKLGTQTNYIISQYAIDASGNPNVAADTLLNQQGVQSKLQLPQVNHFGISYQKDQKFLVGADLTLGHWSDLSIADVNQGMLNSTTVNIGGQYTPDMNALGNYFATVDYRLGFIYDKSYLNIANPTGTGYTNIKSTALTFGLGMPLKPGQTSFYKVNLSVELGQRGKITDGLVKENYINFRLGFTLNDKWFQRYKFD